MNLRKERHLPDEILKPRTMAPELTKTMKPIAALLIVILAGGSAFGIKIIRQLNQIGSRIDRPDPQVEMLRSPEPTPEPVIEEPASPAPIPLELRSIKELGTALLSPLKSENIEDLARVCALVDTWMFPATDEAKADDLIENSLEKLRELIRNKVKALDEQALAADTGNKADELFREASALIQLYPVPSSSEDQQAFESELRRRAEVSRRIQEMRHLRYNQWAVTKIERGFKMFHENLRAFNEGEEDLNLVRTTAGALAEINPDVLTPSVMELYMSLIRQTYEQISEAHRSALAKALNDPGVAKIPLSDF